MRLLVTGSTGFLGGSIGRLAARSGNEVLGIGSSRQPGVGWPGEYVQTDIVGSDLSIIIRDFAPDVLWHATGLASVAGSFDAPFDDFKSALSTWANLLDGVRRSRLRPLILFPSSAAVYGNPNKLPVREDAVIAPISPYGFHKAACELLGREYSECFGLDIIICRFFSIFGAAQRCRLVWELYAQLAGPESTVWLQGSGNESRDYLDIDDVGTVLLRLIANRLRIRRESQYIEHQCLFVNIGRGEETRVLDLAKQLCQLVAPEKSIRCLGLERRGDPHAWCADTSLLQSLVPCWKPTSLSFALSRCVATWQMERRTGHEQ